MLSIRNSRRNHASNAALKVNLRYRVHVLDLLDGLASTHFGRVDLRLCGTIRASGTDCHGLFLLLGCLRLETLAERLDHLAEPVKVEGVKNDVAS